MIGSQQVPSHSNVPPINASALSVISPVTAGSELIVESIAAYGHTPEHNVHHFLCETIGCGGEPAAFVAPSGASVWAGKYDDEYCTFSEPLANEEQKIPLLIATVEHMLSGPGIKKVALELHDSTRTRFLAALPRTMRAIKPRYSLEWPLFDMRAYNPELPGKYFKKLRNTKNHFFTSHALSVVPAAAVPSGTLANIVRAWKGMRKRNDFAYTSTYERHIAEGFPAATSARVLLVNDRPVGFNVGWNIPNRPGAYYAAMGIHDYSVEGMGVVMNLEDLAWIKTQGYHTADFGGTEANGTQFKKQFGPSSYYRSTVFAVERA